MSYVLTPAKDKMNIEEQEYASAKIIQFSKFLSCMGVMAVTTGGEIKGVHLVMFFKDGTQFDDAAAAEVNALFEGCKNGSCVFVGQIASWKGQFPAYGTMLAKLQKQLGIIRIVEKDDGIYGGRLQSGTIEVTTKTAM